MTELNSTVLPSSLSHLTTEGLEPIYFLSRSSVSLAHCWRHRLPHCEVDRHHMNPILLSEHLQQSSMQIFATLNFRRRA